LLDWEYFWSIHSESRPLLLGLGSLSNSADLKDNLLDYRARLFASYMYKTFGVKRTAVK